MPNYTLKLLKILKYIFVIVFFTGFFVWKNQNLVQDENSFKYIYKDFETNLTIDPW